MASSSLPPRLLSAVRAHLQGQTADAERGYRAVLARDAEQPQALRFLGLLLAQREELGRAAAALDAAEPGEHRPGDAEYHRAFALVNLGRDDEALAAGRAAVARDPAHAPALSLLVTLLRDRGEVDEAVALARRAVRAHPAWWTHRELGIGLSRQDRSVESIAALRRAAAAAPRQPEVQGELGLALLVAGELVQAYEQFRRTCELAPGGAAQWNNLGVAAQRLGRFEEADRALRRAVELEPSSARYRYNRGLALLGAGQLVRGWEANDHGFAAGARTPDRTLPLPAWRGDPAPDATLLVWREQGVGDELRYASCYADARARVGRLVVECDHRLVGLLRRSLPDVVVRAEGTGPEPPDADLHCPAGSLPRWLRRSLRDFPPPGGYLTADPDRVARWRRRLAALGPGRTVGVAWRSKKLLTERLSHYTTLDELEPVLAAPGVHAINLQYGDPVQREAELAAFEARTGIVVHRWPGVDYTDDLEDMAALTTCLDLVVSVGTAPAMLAGALGRATWMLALPDPWALGTAHYPWMPSLRRFPRRWEDSWEEPIRQMATALRSAA